MLPLISLHRHFPLSLLHHFGSGAAIPQSSLRGSPWESAGPVRSQGGTSENTEAIRHVLPLAAGGRLPPRLLYVQVRVRDAASGETQRCLRWFNWMTDMAKHVDVPPVSFL